MRLQYLALATVFLFLGACSGGSSRNSNSGGDFFSDCLGGQITVWGEAPIFTSISTSRDKAKDDACRTAVEKCIGTQVASYSAVSNAQSVANEVFTEAKGICKNDQILEEQQYNLDTVKMLKVFVRYKVEPTDLNNQINSMQKLVGNPKVMVLLREEYNLSGAGKRVVGFGSRDSISGGSLADFLIQKGYSLIDPSKAGIRIGNEEAVADNPELLSEAIKDKAAAAGADVLIVGSIQADKQDLAKSIDYGATKMGFKSYAATGSVSVITLWGTGKLLGTFNKPENGANISDMKAAQEAFRRYAVGSAKDPSQKPGGLAKQVHDRLQSEWSALVQNNEVVMKITGADRNTVATFRDDLVERTGVKNVNEIKSSESEVIWEVIYPGRSFALADTLAFYREDPRMFLALKGNPPKKFNVTNVNRGEIQIRFE